jgi:hydroxymethylpyrimidine pyrophosphatase-like HAD family hydrolase
MKSRESYIIAVDFDGTIVEHAFPEVGKPLPHAIETLKELQAAGHRLILHTARGKGYGGKKDYLEDAIEYCHANGLYFWGVNHNPDQQRWTDSKKIYANLYIDDTALGTPLDANGSVDWLGVRKLLAINGINYKEII